MSFATYQEASRTGSTTQTCRGRKSEIPKLENVSIANALQLEAARRLYTLLYVARGKFEVAQPIRCRFRAYLLFIRYVTL